jgi:hypothetical protein
LIENNPSMKACRICFETHTPLYHPCKCSGSIKYIHEECLFHWLQSRDDNRDIQCELCKEPYLLVYNHLLEVDVLTPPYRSFFLINPSWHIANHCVSVILVQYFLPLAPIDLIYILVHYVYNITYLSIWYLYVWKTVKQRSQYYTLFLTGHSPTAIGFHCILMTATLATYIDKHLGPLLLLIIANQCYLGIYPILHSGILKNINQDRKIIIKNRGPE